MERKQINPAYASAKTQQNTTSNQLARHLNNKSVLSKIPKPFFLPGSLAFFSLLFLAAIYIRKSSIVVRYSLPKKNKTYEEYKIINNTNITNL